MTLSPEHKALVTRLRDLGGTRFNDCHESADAIEALDIELEDARIESAIRNARAEAAEATMRRDTSDPLVKLLKRWLKQADSGRWRDTAHLSLAAHPLADDTRVAVAATDDSAAFSTKLAEHKALVARLRRFLPPSLGGEAAAAIEALAADLAERTKGTQFLVGRIKSLVNRAEAAEERAEALLAELRAKETEIETLAAKLAEKEKETP